MPSIYQEAVNGATLVWREAWPDIKRWRVHLLGFFVSEVCFTSMLIISYELMSEILFKDIAGYV